jgi:hypothetical protein
MAASSLARDWRLRSDSSKKTPTFCAQFLAKPNVFARLKSRTIGRGSKGPIKPRNSAFYAHRPSPLSKLLSQPGEAVKGLKTCAKTGFKNEKRSREGKSQRYFKHTITFR